MTKLVNEQKAYQEKLQAQIDQLEAEFDKARAKTKELAADKKIQLNEKMEQLEVKLKQAKGKLAQILDTAEDKWKETKSSLNDLMTRIKQDLAKLSSDLGLN